MLVKTRDHGDYEVDDAQVGSWMIDCGVAEWLEYNDFGSLDATYHDDGSVTVTDTDEGKSRTITPVEFFSTHLDYVYHANMPEPPTGAAYSWYKWATYYEGATPDDYDAWTCDFILQILLYGEIIYG